ncbi:MAG: FAD/NAD(P)-binding protein, partial [Gemmatimonadaceae bacterium]|nr:FAD/NAD(P)-binding protein [Chitinophagaceae bacterium]
MKIETPETHIGIIGGGPMALMLYKRLIESGIKNLKITIFEKQKQLGVGMPYSSLGANDEHVTNVSDIEIPELVMPMKEWIKTAPTELLKRFDINSANFNEYKVVPRLLLGEYLSDQFEILLEHSKKIGLKTVVKFETAVTDVVDERDSLTIVTNKGEVKGLHHIMIATGHQWSAKNDKKFKNYFDSPYPPSKLKIKANYPVAIKGASLTAIDAIRTLARENGCFSKNEDGSLTYNLNDDSPEFSLILHSIDGLLPAIRFHLEDVHHSDDSVLSDEETKEVMDANDGFIPLDYLFERNFKNSFIKKDSDFYQEIKNLTIEAFVEKMMALREKLDAFVLFKAEYAEAEKSIKRKESIYWKEMLTELSFAMNYPAKHFSAEDMIRLKKVLIPLISIVIAHVPQSSCRELIALYDANVLTLIEVNPESKVEP